MKIRMKVTLYEYPKEYRPIRKKVYDVVKIARAAYHPQTSYLYVLSINDERVIVFPEECEVIR